MKNDTDLPKELDPVKKVEQLPLFPSSLSRTSPIFFDISFYVPESGVTFPGRIVWQNSLVPCVKDMAELSGLDVVTWGLYEQDDWGPPKAFVPHLESALSKLKEYSSWYKPLERGIGINSSYESLVSFVESYLQACHNYPEAIIAINH